MVTAWDGYQKHAMGHNELKPLAKRGHSAGIFGSSRMGATVVDALDTLYIMGLKDEFKQARDWVAQHLNFGVVSYLIFSTITVLLAIVWQYKNEQDKNLISK